MIEINCKIKGKNKINERNYYEIIEVQTGDTHIIPEYQLNHRKIEIEKEYTFYKNYNKEADKYYFEIKNEPIELVIVGPTSYINKKGVKKDAFLVKYQDKEIIVACFNWQSPNTWQKKTIKCTLERFTKAGEPILKNRDYSHPFFEINEIYDFNVMGNRKRSTSKGEIDLYTLEGIDKHTYEVSMLPGQLQNHSDVKSVKCKVTEICQVIKLRQVDFKDPYYFKVEKIIINKTFINKYFNHIINSNKENEDEDEKQLIEQYESGSAFWVFTYANKILPRIFKESIDRYDYKSAIQINSLIILFEKWIISKGILTSIKDKLLKDKTSKKAQRLLELSHIKEEMLNLISTHEFSFLNEFMNTKKSSVCDLFHLIKYSNPLIIDDKILHEVIILLQSRGAFQQNEYYTEELQRLF